LSSVSTIDREHAQLPGRITLEAGQHGGSVLVAERFEERPR
jgi:hypothetical protein